MLPEADAGRAVLISALAQLPVTGLLESAAGDMIVELAEDGALDDLLRALHAISPQVFISRVGAPEARADGRQIKVRRLAPGTVPG